MDKLAVSLRDLPDKLTLREIWCDLEARADGGFFLSWGWIGCWLDSIDSKALLLEARLQDRAVALGIFCQRENALFLHESGNPALDRIAIEYNGFLTDRTAPPNATAQCLDAVNNYGESGGRTLSRLVFHNVGDAFASALENAGMPERMTADAGGGLVDLQSLRRSGTAYLDRLSGNTRRQIRRAMRLYEERGSLRVEPAGAVGEALEFLEALGELHQQTWNRRNKTGAFSSPEFVAFHRRLVEDRLPEDEVDLLRVRAGESVIGYLYNFRYRGRVYYYASGFVYEADNRLKPGLVCHALAIEHYREAGQDCYDFMAGTARYKSSLGEPGPRLRSYVLERPGARLLVTRALRRVKSAIIPSGTVR